MSYKKESKLFSLIDRMINPEHETSCSSVLVNEKVTRDGHRSKSERSEMRSINLCR